MVRFFRYTGEADSKGLILPKPCVQCVTPVLVMEFLRIAFVILGLPCRQELNENNIKFKIKFFSHWAFECIVPRQTSFQDLYDLWDQAGSILGEHIPIRLICGGKQMCDRQAEIRHFARPDDTGSLRVTVHSVLGLRGGGPSSDANQGTKARNALATFLLTQGMDLGEVAPFADKVVKAAGPQAVITIMDPKQVAKKWDGLVKLTKSMNISIPDAATKFLQRSERVKQTVRKHVQPSDDLINLDGVVFQPGFFLNADGSKCIQVYDVKPKSTGVILLGHAQAEPWLMQQSHITADEFAIGVVGHCQGSKQSACQRLQMPGFDSQKRPLILSICLHNIGQKKVSTKHAECSKIPVHDSSVLCFTVYRDECTPEDWENMIKHPVKHVLNAIDAQPEQMPLLAPPWGRVYQRQHKQASPSEAESFQFHARVRQDLVLQFLRLSGTHGTYISAKTEDRVLSKEFQVIWLHLSHMQLQVSATSMPKCLGIVRTMRRDGKISKGLRFATADYREAFGQLRPGDTPPPDVKPNHLFKIYPTPLGASIDSVQKFLDAQAWGARPLRSLSSTAWLCVCDTPFDAVFASWNEHSILVKWVEQSQSSKQLVLAGQLPKISSGSGFNPSVDGFQTDDPWATWNQKQGRVTSSPQLPAQVVRNLDAPIEDRFKKHESAMTEMQSQIKNLQATVKTQAVEVDAGQKKLQADVQQLRSDCKTQFDTMASQFQSTLETALKNQQGDMSKQFSELKIMLQRQGKKRPKGPTAAANDGNKSDEDMSS